MTSVDQKAPSKVVEMRMKKVLTAEEIAGISFRKQDVDKQLEQAAASEHVEETPAESGNKRKAAGTSEAQKKKKKTPKQLEDMRNDNFVAIEPRSADLPPPINEHVEETQPTTPRVNPELQATATSKDKVKKDRDAAEEARKAVELTAAETKTLLIQERKKNQELVGAVDQAKGETERVRLEK
ncbi:uncharacterized protein [Rutidosis leptorrhynchoides]|uniref:uncharacterized protein n=1 Tax=Rutidosis leptorrhynchoides TaxID=125765 RepID=UPI003A99197D